MIPALLTLWLCVYFFRPVKPWRADEERWYWYARERGRHTWGVTIAWILTFFMLVFWLGTMIPSSPNRDMSKLRGDYSIRSGDFYWVLDDHNDWRLERS